MNALAPALAAICPTRWREALADPKLNQPPCRWTIASPDRQSAGRTQSPGTPPRVSVSNVTSSRGNTFSMKASNCPRASIPCRAPLAELTMARKAAVIAASSGSSGCTTTEPVDVRSLVDPCIASSSLNWLLALITAECSHWGPRWADRRQRLGSEHPEGLGGIHHVAAGPGQHRLHPAYLFLGHR